MTRQKDREEPSVTCGVCPHFCTLTEGQLGRCGARIAQNGRVVDQNYGRVTALALDPIEKKPLARFQPGTRVLSVGSYGCNMDCGFCQNSSIACGSATTTNWDSLTPEVLVELAVKARAQGNVGIAFTYNEPLVGWEFVRDVAQLSHRRGLANVLVSNGLVNPGILSELLPLVDAANIDLKGFCDAIYAQLDGDFDCVKKTIATLAACPECHLEVTTLIVPGLNDNANQIEAAAAWLATLDPSIVYHLTRFFPCHRFCDRPPTDPALVRSLASVAARHLPHVEVGNC